MVHARNSGWAASRDPKRNTFMHLEALAFRSHQMPLPNLAYYGVLFAGIDLEVDDGFRSVPYPGIYEDEAEWKCSRGTIIREKPDPPDRGRACTLKEGRACVKKYGIEGVIGLC